MSNAYIEVQEIIVQPLSARHASTHVELPSILPAQKHYPRWPMLVWGAVFFVGLVLMTWASTRNSDGTMFSREMWWAACAPILAGMTGMGFTAKGWVRD